VLGVDIIANTTLPKGAPSNVRKIRYNGRYGAREMLVARDPDTGDYEPAEADSVATEVERGGVTDELLAKRIAKARNT